MVKGGAAMGRIGKCKFEDSATKLFDGTSIAERAIKRRVSTHNLFRDISTSFIADVMPRPMMKICLHSLN